MVMGTHNPPDADPKEAWERLPGEPNDAHAAFRIFRDMLPADRVIVKVARAIRKSEAQTRRWARKFDWWERCAAWDDQCNKIEDGERLARLQAMHAKHQEAGEKAIELALRALDALTPADLTGPAAVRLLEFGVKMQRSMMVEDEPEPTEDPWELIARELDPSSVT